jgi:hypothetical protein
MQINGQPSAAAPNQTVTLPRPDGSDWTFTLQPLPLGFHRRLRDHGVTPPTAPIRIARDSHGRPLRDDAGLAVTQADLTDSRYVADLELYHQRIAVLALAESLQADPNVRFDAPKPGDGVAGSSWPAYADALYAELESAGFTAGDLIHLCHSIGRLSNLLGDHLHQARANFSSPRIPAAP